jgi:hypothetical protein
MNYNVDTELYDHQKLNPMDVAEEYYHIGWSQGYDQAIESLISLAMFPEVEKTTDLDTLKLLDTLRQMKEMLDRSER